jgi:predicted Zn-dependent peptidase
MKEHAGISHRLLSNGMRLLVKEMDRDIASFGICIPFGYVHDNWLVSRFAHHHAKTSKIGLMHLLEHILFRKTKSRSYGQINDEMKLLVADGRLKAETDGHSVFYYGTCRKENFQHMAELISDIVFHATLPKGAVEKEKKIVLQERTDTKEDMGARALQNLQLLMFPTHPIRNFGLDHPQGIQSISQSLLKKIYNIIYVPSHAIAVAAGNFDTAALTKTLEKFQKGSHRIFGPRFKESENPKSRVFREQRPGVVKTALAYGFQAPLPGDNDFYALEIIDAILNMGFGSYVKQCVREGPGLAYSIDTGFDFSKHHSVYYASFLIEHDDLRKVQDRFRRSIQRLQNSAAQKEFAISKEALKNQDVISLDSTENFVEEMLKTYLFFGKPKTDYIKHIEAVTFEEVRSASRKYLDLSKAFVSMIRPKRTS